MERRCQQTEVEGDRTLATAAESYHKVDIWIPFQERIQLCCAWAVVQVGADLRGLDNTVAPGSSGDQQIEFDRYELVERVPRVISPAELGIEKCRLCTLIAARK